MIKKTLCTLKIKAPPPHAHSSKKEGIEGFHKQKFRKSIQACGIIHIILLTHVIFLNREKPCSLLIVHSRNKYSGTCSVDMLFLECGSPKFSSFLSVRTIVIWSLLLFKYSVNSEKPHPCLPVFPLVPQVLRLEYRPEKKM